MRTALISVILLWLASGLTGSAAAPPAAATPPPAASATPGSATTPAPGNPPAKAPGAKPAAPSDSASEPERIDPTEKVHSDTEISFPVDI